jgi:ribonuclease J
VKLPPKDKSELLFVPLGGAGEIGMNLNLYGYGPEDNRKWIILDIGVMFGGDDTPGIDVIMPDSGFIEERRRDLLGIVLTHAHEDHIGAIGHLWPKLRAPIYATPFTAELVKHKLAEQGVENAPLHVIPLGAKLTLGPFELEFISITHSIPEPNCVVIRTPLGTVFHTGDWKLDPDPQIGQTTDDAAIRAAGAEGVLAMVCDSTNVFVEGRSGSEADVARALRDLVGKLSGRVAIACFASNVARVQSAVRAARAHGRHVALSGRSMKRIAAAAIETGYLRDLPPFIDEHDAKFLPPEKVLFLCTGSQGEPRAALSKIAEGAHPHISLGPNDSVIFSSRVIPGNERSIHALHNTLAMRGVEVITADDHPIHTSGHPARDELTQMYEWVRPRIAIPVHGEARHMAEHVRLAKSLQVPEVLLTPNGSIVRLAPGPAAIIDEAPSGRMYVDGSKLSTVDDSEVKARLALSYAGIVVVTIVLDNKGRMLTDPIVICDGVPDEVAEVAEDAAIDAAETALQTRKKDLDDDALADIVKKAVRRAVQSEWNKRPVTRVEVVRAG